VYVYFKGALMYTDYSIRWCLMEADCKTIFFVDDNITNLRVGSNALDEYYNVLTLNSGARRILAAL